MPWFVTGAAGGTQPVWACCRTGHCCAQEGSDAARRVACGAACALVSVEKMEEEERMIVRSE